MRNLPIDCSQLIFRTVEVVGHYDRLTGEQRTTRDGAVPIWNVHVLVQGTDDAPSSKPEVLEVRVPSLSDLGTVLTPFEIMTFSSLSARPWAMVNDGRGADGVTFSATGVQTVKASPNGVKPAKSEPVPAVAS